MAADPERDRNVASARASSPSPAATMIAGLRRLPDLRAALEGLGLFIAVIAAGVWGVSSGVLTLDPAPRSDVLLISISAFLVPALCEELAFRGWVRQGAPIAAVASLLAFIFWHPFQVMANLPFARPEFTDAGFLILVATLGACCTLSRIRSGSLWPGVIIHWGVAVVWRVLYAGPGGPSLSG